MIDQLADGRLVWASFAAFDQAIEELLADPMVESRADRVAVHTGGLVHLHPLHHPCLSNQLPRCLGEAWSLEFCRRGIRRVDFQRDDAPEAMRLSAEVTE